MEMTDDVHTPFILEYETALGRIIAVNMAHMKRREAREKRDSVFEEIVKTNKGILLHNLTYVIILFEILECSLAVFLSQVRKQSTREKVAWYMY